MRSVQQYVDSLRDGRTVYFRGRRVEDVTSHPVLRAAIDHAAIDYRMAEDERWRDLAVVTSEEGQPYSRYFALPQTPQDLLHRSRLIEEATRLGGTLVVLIKEIGTDALFGLHILAAAMDQQLGTAYLPRVQAFYRHCRDHDLAMAVAQTDVKGDRSLGPVQQAHPDYYLRIVDRRDDGIVVRGAKVHTSVSVNSNELIVLPTRALGEGDAAYAVAFAVPINTPGLKLLASPYGGHQKNRFEHPISAHHKMVETLTVFDDVFVPRERVFLEGEWQFAGPLALTFVEYHRFTAVSYKLPLVDLLVGSAWLAAEYNGILRAGHVREKLSRLVAYAETLRALVEMAAQRAKRVEPGLVAPDPLTVNMAKLHFAEGYHQALMAVQDLAGGLLVTGPGLEDLSTPETAEYVRRYLGGANGASALDRLRALNLISDLTASDFAGYQAVLAIHAEGSIEAEKLVMLRSYNSKPALAYARELAGINA
ncbi:MAG: gamma-aminobutyrate dehydratase [Chloroflexi bacterium]|nr:gamma-aminobutyrate dehydratase [Chloroflexota bacterium]